MTPRKPSKGAATRRIAVPAAAKAAGVTEATETTKAPKAAKAKAERKPRVIMPKAEPATVRAFFKSTGLNRKELAGAVGVGIGVIATVQAENGDRWSQERFERAKTAIEKYRKEHPPVVEATAKAPKAVAAKTPRAKSGVAAANAEATAAA